MLLFRFGKVVMFIPTLEISISRPSFYKGVQFKIILWSKGISLTITTKRAYQEFRDKEKANMERIAREKANPPT